MVMQTNAFATYGAVGNKEDLTDVIYNISPVETPFCTSVPRAKAKNTLHEWQIDALAPASTANAHLEGDVVTGAASTATTRAKNYCQISRKDVVVTGTQEVVDKAGRDSEMAYQIAKRGKELKRDMEAILTGNQGWVAGDSTTARKLRSLESWLTTNADRNAGATTPGADSTGSADPAQDASATRAFTETLLKNVIQQVYASGGEPKLLMVGPHNKQVVSTFTGRTSAHENIEPGQIQASASLYASDFGDIRVIPNRFQRERSAFVIDPEFAAVAYLRPIKTMNLAKVSDAERKFMVAEYTLEMRNEAAHGVVADIAVS